MSLTQRSESTALLQNQHGEAGYVREEDEHEIELTGHTIKTVKTYAGRLAYIYSCIYSTSTGPETLAAALSPEKIKFLTDWAQFQRIFFYRILWIMYIACVILQVVYNIGHSEDENHPKTISGLVCGCVIAVPALFTFVLILIDVYVFFAIDQPLQVAFNLVPTHKVDDLGDSCNKFVTYTRTQTLSAGLKTDDLAYGTQLQSKSEIKFMMYTDVWSTQHLLGEYRFCGSSIKLAQPGIGWSITNFLYFGLVAAWFFVAPEEAQGSLAVIVLVLLWAAIGNILCVGVTLCFAACFCPCLLSNAKKKAEIREKIKANAHAGNQTKAPFMKKSAYQF